MNSEISRITMCSFFLFAIFFSKGTFSAYIEGVDTTDVNGYGLDSAFKIDSANFISGDSIAYYVYTPFSASGAFNYNFDDIKFSTDSTYFKKNPYFLRIPSYCFTIKKIKDSTYSKVQITEKLSGNRYIFKFGTNTTPNNHLFEKTDYDRSVLYKPNNLFYSVAGVGPYLGSYIRWDPPLPNDNHLKGYIICVQKNIVIDTSAPINLAQWDSIGFTDSNNFSFRTSFYGEYFNIAAVYAEGKSEFLKGWTKTFIPSIVNGLHSKISNGNNLSIKIKQNGILFTCADLSDKYFILNIYDIHGKHIFRITTNNSNRVFWNTADRKIAQGTYILKAELPDRSVINQTLMFTR